MSDPISCCLITNSNSSIYSPKMLDRLWDAESFLIPLSLLSPSRNMQRTRNDSHKNCGTNMTKTKLLGMACRGRAERNMILATQNLSYLHLQGRPDCPSHTQHKVETNTISSLWKESQLLEGFFFFFFHLKNLNLCVTANLHTPCHKSPPVSLYSEGANIPSKVPNNSNLIGCLSIREEIPEKLAGMAKSL